MKYQQDDAVCRFDDMIQAVIVPHADCELADVWTDDTLAAHRLRSRSSAAAQPSDLISLLAKWKRENCADGRILASGDIFVLCND